ncbi:hypothetical protein [Streptomyces sp. NPDC048269]|uniref:hypothetical protein n=1 Tax=Streptomyces sp. NPDC048269 TaxID=3155753 RepID=UPI0034227EE6
MGGTAARSGSGLAVSAAAAVGLLAPGPADCPTAAVVGPRQEISPAARAATAKGIPHQTQGGYTGDWARFEQWAARAGHCPLPASAETLTEYVTWCTLTPRPRTGRPYKPSSIDPAMAAVAVAVAHRAAGLPQPSQTGARLVLRGYEAELKATKDPRGKARKGAAATPRVLQQMIAATDTSTLIGARGFIHWLWVLAQILGSSRRGLLEEVSLCFPGSIRSAVSAAIALRRARLGLSLRRNGKVGVLSS